MSLNTDRRTSRQIIWDAIQEMAAMGQAITRKTLQEVTGLTYHIVDDHVSRFVDEDGTLRRVVDGVFELVKGYDAPRPVSVTDLDDGQTIIEVGDQEMRLWPREVRKVAMRLAGEAQQLATMQLQHDVALATQGLQLEFRGVQREMAARIKEQDETIKRLQQQLAEKPIQAALI
ncbi:hypothetical protein N5D37_12890 [Comamonas aquatica]|jgi:hypothetical protein|uniref:hypothetical protein n=1 Tax=Comamonas aquatica TaxID=225991 RepID=UPI00244A76C8|nr:hypothetical protein [Comamonas aquatica]MDH1766523.1 hypothetical protein [Comamonas aquatica]